MNSHISMPLPPTPYPITINDMVTLRPLTAKDAQSFFKFVESNRGNLEQFDPFVNAFHSPEDVRKTLVKIETLAKNGKSLSCGIWDHGQFIGWVNGGLDHEKKIIKVGYGLATSHQGQGIVTRAAQAVISFAFTHLGMTKATLTTRTDNTKSIKVAERLGFKRAPKPLPPLHGQPAEVIRYEYILAKTT